MGRQRKKNSHHALQHDEEPPEQQPRGSKQQRRGANKRKINKRNFLGGGDENFRRMLEEDGTKTIVDMAADGNCLFRSLSDQLTWDYGDNHEEVRSDVCDFLEIHEDEFSAFLVLDENEDDEDAADFESYISAMRDSGEWGGNLELVAAARLYRRNVKVFSLAAAYTIEHGEKASTGPDLMISYHDNDHYNSLRDSKAKKPPCKPVKIMPVRPELTSPTTTKIEEESTSSESKISGTSTAMEEDDDDDSAITLSKRGRRKVKKGLPTKGMTSTGKTLPQKPAGRRKSKKVVETPTNNFEKDNDKAAKTAAAKMETDLLLASKQTTRRNNSVEQKKQLVVAEQNGKPIEIPVKMDGNPSLSSEKQTRQTSSVDHKQQLVAKVDTEQAREPIETSAEMDVDLLLAGKKITKGRKTSVERKKQSVVKAGTQQSPEPIEISVKLDLDPPLASKKITRGRKSSVERKNQLAVKANTQQAQEPVEISVKMDVAPTLASKKITKRKSSVERKKEWVTKPYTSQAQQPIEEAVKMEVDPRFQEKRVKVTNSEPAIATVNTNIKQTEKATAESFGKVCVASILGEDKTSGDLTNAIMAKMAIGSCTGQGHTLLVESLVEMDTDSVMGEEVERGESNAPMGKLALEAYNRQAQDLLIAEVDIDPKQDEKAEKEARNGLVLLADTALTQERMELPNMEFDPTFDETAVSMKSTGLIESDELIDTSSTQERMELLNMDFDPTFDEMAVSTKSKGLAESHEWESTSEEPPQELDGSTILGISVCDKSCQEKSKTVSERKATSKGKYVELAAPLSAGNARDLEPGSSTAQKPAAKRKGKKGGPCYCGSGNTYRKCCKEKEKKERAALRRDSSIVTDDDDETQKSKKYEMENGFRVLKI